MTAVEPCQYLKNVKGPRSRWDDLFLYSIDRVTYFSRRIVCRVCIVITFVLWRSLLAFRRVDDPHGRVELYSISRTFESVKVPNEYGMCLDVLL